MYTNTIAIPHSYFEQHTNKEYSDWREALVREYVQNGRDCGSKKIEIEICDNQMIVQNDGKPMSLDLMLNVLLALGGSQKDEGATGGFGQAKNLLYFRWNEWSVCSGRYVIKGSGPTYSEPIELFHSLEGTRSVVKLNDDDTSWIRNRAERYLNKCFLGSCKVFLNGHQIKGTEHRGRVIKTLHSEGEEFAKVYFNKARTDSYARVYVNGLYMFETCYLDELQGAVAIELTKPSTEVLTANRDGLQWKYERVLQTFIRDLIKDNRKVTRERGESVWLNHGIGQVHMESQEELCAFNSAPTKQHALEMTLDTLVQVADMIERTTHIKQASENKPLKQPEKTFEQIIPEDHLIVREAESKMTNGKIKKYLETKKAKGLFVQWVAIVKAVLRCQEYEGSFTPGFIFSEETRGERRTHESRQCILINPMLIEKGLDARCQLDYMMQVAVHECCHLHHKYHDENFILAFHALWSKCMKEYKAFQKLELRKVMKNI